jgi:hypothetical protein
VRESAAEGSTPQPCAASAMKRAPYLSGPAPTPKAPLPFTLPSRKREGGAAGADGHIAGAGAMWASPASAPCAPPGASEPVPAAGTEESAPATCIASASNAAAATASAFSPAAPPRRASADSAASADSSTGTSPSSAAEKRSGDQARDVPGRTVDAPLVEAVLSVSSRRQAAPSATEVPAAPSTLENNSDWTDDVEPSSVNPLCPAAIALPEVVLPVAHPPRRPADHNHLQLQNSAERRHEQLQRSRPADSMRERTAMKGGPPCAGQDRRIPHQDLQRGPPVEDAPPADVSTAGDVEQHDVMKRKAELAAERRRAYEVEQQNQRGRAEVKLRELEARLALRSESSASPSGPGRAPTTVSPVPKVLLRRPRADPPAPAVSPSAARTTTRDLPPSSRPKASRQRRREPPPERSDALEAAQAVVNMCIQRATHGGRGARGAGGGPSSDSAATSDAARQAPASFPSRGPAATSHGVSSPDSAQRDDDSASKKAGRKRGGRVERLKRERREARAAERTEMPPLSSESVVAPGLLPAAAAPPPSTASSLSGTAVATEWKVGSRAVQPTSFADISRAFSNHPTTIPLGGNPAVPAVHVPDAKSAWKSAMSLPEAEGAWDVAAAAVPAPDGHHSSTGAPASFWATGFHATSQDVWGVPADKQVAYAPNGAETWDAAAAALSPAPLQSWDTVLASSPPRPESAPAERRTQPAEAPAAAGSGDPEMLPRHGRRGQRRSGVLKRDAKSDTAGNDSASAAESARRAASRRKRQGANMPITGEKDPAVTVAEDSGVGFTEAAAAAGGVAARRGRRQRRGRGNAEGGGRGCGRGGGGRGGGKDGGGGGGAGAAQSPPRAPAAAEQ